MPLAPPTTEQLKETMRATYFNLRRGMVVLSFLFPLIFYGYFVVVGPGDLQLDSMSAFYGTHGIARDSFVGILWAVGSFLVGYKGLTTFEDWLLNSAGVCAGLIALIPCGCWIPDAPHNKWHVGFAVGFFVLMSLVVLRFGDKTINLLPESRRKFFRVVYNLIAFFLIASVGTVVVLHLLLSQYKAYVFRVEWLGIWAFSAYWGFKSYEYSLSDVEKRAVRGELRYDAKLGLVPIEPAVPIE